MVQISGDKSLTLFEPHQNENLYEGHIPEALLGYDKANRKIYRKKLLESTSMVMSPVDITDPDYERFPNFAHTKRLKCTLKPGDVLYMPAFWWHEVQSYPDALEQRNLAVNYWYACIVFSYLFDTYTGTNHSLLKSFHVRNADWNLIIIMIIYCKIQFFINSYYNN